MGKATDLAFEEHLLEGIIVERRNRFIVDVMLNNVLHTCHCPSTGKIGNFDLRGRPCLLSRGNNPKRKTEYTMEAISLDLPSKEHKSWIGVNQNASNRYVAHFLENGSLEGIVGTFKTLQREAKLGNSRIDFLLDDSIFIEVKSPLWRIDLEIPDYIATRDNGVFNSYERIMKHLNSFISCMKPYQKSIMLACFMYDHPGMYANRGGARVSNTKLSRMFDRCTNLELWQINFQISKRGIRLLRYFRI